MSHDLRTPLAVVRGAASTLVEGDEMLTREARRDLASAVLEETERLDRQVGNLLDMMRLESGAVRIRKEWLSLEEVLGAAYNRMERRLAGRDVRIDVPPDLFARIDGVLLEQLFANLLENAAKYTASATPVEIVGRRSGDSVVIDVSDRGPGIPVEEAPHVFEKFYRGASERTRGGVGLGLTICRAIASVHGGTIDVTNREGGGARFRVTLPVGQAPPALMELPEIPGDAS